MSDTRIAYIKTAIFKSSGTWYFGDKDTNGTWKITRASNDLVFYRRESGSYVEKMRITA